MIAKLRGTVDQVGEDWAVIDVNGVGYLVSCPGRTLSGLVVGKPATFQANPAKLVERCVEALHRSPQWR